MKDLALDENGDIYISDAGDAIIVNGIDAVKQRLHTRLLRFLGEWYLNISLGVPYIQEILVKNPSQTAVVNNIKKTILDTDGVTSLTDFEIRINTDNSGNISSRSVIVSFTATTDKGDITDEISATIN